MTRPTIDIDQLQDDLRMLQHHQLGLQIDGLTAYSVMGALQLALRHEAFAQTNLAPMVEAVAETIQDTISITPTLKLTTEMGWHCDEDLPLGQPEPGQADGHRPNRPNLAMGTSLTGQIYHALLTAHQVYPFSECTCNTPYHDWHGYPCGYCQVVDALQALYDLTTLADEAVNQLRTDLADEGIYTKHHEGVQLVENLHDDLCSPQLTRPADNIFPEIPGDNPLTEIQLAMIERAARSSVPTGHREAMMLTAVMSLIREVRDHRARLGQPSAGGTDFDDF